MENSCDGLDIWYFCVINSSCNLLQISHLFVFFFPINKLHWVRPDVLGFAQFSGSLIRCISTSTYIPLLHCLPLLNIEPLKSHQTTTFLRSWMGFSSYGISLPAKRKIRWKMEDLSFGMGRSMEKRAENTSHLRSAALLWLDPFCSLPNSDLSKGRLLIRIHTQLQLSYLSQEPWVVHVYCIYLLKSRAPTTLRVRLNLFWFARHY